MSQNTVDVNAVLSVYKAKLNNEIEQNTLLQAEVMQLRQYIQEQEEAAMPSEAIVEDPESEATE